MSHVESSVASGRQASRVRLVVPCEIKGSKETIKVPVRDISLDGIRLLSSESHAVGDTLKVTLRVPARIELSAEVRWVDTETAKGHYILGCRFVHAGESRQSLKDMLQNLATSIDSAARRVR
jgi:hypothetical protein